MHVSSFVTRAGLALLIFVGTSGSVYADLDSDIRDIQHEWARANYATEKDQQEKVFENLLAHARQLVEQYPGKAEPLVWLAISLSSDAGVNGGFGALGKVKEARKHLEAAERINPGALNGSIYTSLGSLYYQVPGWPLGFGNNDKAELYLKKALSINPDGIDPNYFYGDFMLEKGNYDKAIEFLNKANQAPPRSDRPLADKGRHDEINEKLQQAEESL